jgi:hypothetical protein
MTIGQLSGKKKRARVAVPKYERTIAVPPKASRNHQGHRDGARKSGRHGVRQREREGERERERERARRRRRRSERAASAL